jgi:hypothetical protein
MPLINKGLPHPALRRDSRFSTAPDMFFLFFHPVQKVRDEKREKQILLGGE